jgi:DNA polymerase I-like protein with 3'-5' exonuclease and polymerase domains
VKKVKMYREALNARGKFCESVLESLAYCGTGNTHPAAKLFGTYTDRMTVASKQGRGADERPIGWALHQMKRGKEFREIVCAPPPDPILAPEGYDIVEFDAAGQEFRWMAIASGDATMLGLCLPGEDSHSFMGANIVGMDYRELVRLFALEDVSAVQNRYLGKFANLSLQYRTSARKLRVKARIDYDIPMELPEAQRIHSIYQKTYPGVPVYWERQIALVKQLGYVETFGGNRVRVEGDWNGTWGWSMGSTAINTRIQGTGADQKHLAMKHLKHLINQFDGRFLFDLHDGLYMVLPTDKRAKAVDVMKPVLDNLPYDREWGFTPPIPMPWDCKVGRAWGRLKEQKFS